MDFEQFYPTPLELGRTLCSFFQERPTKVLEPSAGQGHLLRALRERYATLGKDRIDVYEIDPERHPLLREQATVCGMDFLESGDLSRYSHILMNPPFRQGVTHVLHAWNHLFSGEIVAILNASGVREPTTKEEMRLARLIEQYGRVQYAEGAFQTEETIRKTSVEVALVYLNKEPSDQFWNGDILERLEQVLELYCARQGWTFEIIADLGSGMNYHKKGLKRLLDAVIDGQVGRLVITHKDRLLRFGAELVFAICEAKNVEVVILNQGEDSTFEEDLAKDVLEIITVIGIKLGSAEIKRALDGL